MLNIIQQIFKLIIRPHSQSTNSVSDRIPPA